MSARLHAAPPQPAAAGAIYLDHHATTPVDPRVTALMIRVLEHDFGNPHSVEHVFGAAAQQQIEWAARHAGALVGAEPEDVRFTGSATEALRLALGYELARARGALTVAASRIEHPASIELLTAAERGGHLQLRWIECDGVGRVNPAAVGAALDEGADVIWLMAANNEVGALQPIAECAAVTTDAGASIVVDASQAAGRIPIEATAWGIDYLILSGHKLYGPKGAGALIGSGLGRARSPLPLESHSPTPNTPAIAGFGEACRLRRLEMALDEPRIGVLRDEMLASLRAVVPDLEVNGPLGDRLAGNLNVSIREAPNDQVLAALRCRLAISTGAACTSGTDAPSHVLRAMGLPVWRQETALRIGIGRSNTDFEIARAVDLIAAAVKEVRGQ